MKNLTILVLLMGLISGCEPKITRQQQLTIYRSRCQDYGYCPGTREFSDCIKEQEALSEELEVKHRKADALEERNRIERNKTFVSQDRVARPPLNSRKEAPFHLMQIFQNSSSSETVVHSSTKQMSQNRAPSHSPPCVPPRPPRQGPQPINEGPPRMPLGYGAPDPFPAYDEPEADFPCVPPRPPRQGPEPINEGPPRMQEPSPPPLPPGYGAPDPFPAPDEPAPPPIDQEEELPPAYEDVGHLPPGREGSPPVYSGPPPPAYGMQ